MVRKFIASLVGILSLTGCANMAASLANLPVSFDDSAVQRDVAYGPLAEHRLDIYYPDHEVAQELPVILFIHGGKWSYGDKTQYPFVAQRFTQRGYVVAVINYRKYPDVTFPAFIEDTARAIAWLHAEAASLNIDASQLYVLGHSAGAHMGALVSADARYMQAHGGERQWIAGFAGLAGPYAFTPEADDLKAIFGPPERYPLMRVTTHIDGQQPPMLLMHGAEDTTVGLFNGERLKQAIDDKGGVVTLSTYEGLDHIDMVGIFSWVYAHDRGITDDIDQFFRKHGAQPAFQ